MLEGLLGGEFESLYIALEAGPQASPEHFLEAGLRAIFEAISTKSLILDNEMLYLILKNHVIKYYSC